MNPVSDLVRAPESDRKRIWRSLLKSITIGVVAICFLTSSGAVATPQNSPAPDNTKANQRDRSKPTADQGGNSAVDRDIMRRIRKSVLDDKSLSSYAHNAKIIAHDGKVTLKGPVRSETEKQTVGQKATEVAGAGNVTNELTIAPAKSKQRD